MIIPGLIYLERINSTDLQSIPSLFDLSKALAATFDDKIQNSLIESRFTWHTDFVDTDSQKHVEKWVEKIGFHFQLYAARYPPRIVSTTIPASVMTTARGRVPLLKLERKVVSGDVSGTLGEALMASILVIGFGLRPSSIVHLKATKQTGRAPDFYILDIPNDLASFIDPLPNAIIDPPLVIEAKGAAMFDQTSIASKLANAFQQIEQIRTGYGLAAVFVRDPVNRHYHVLMVAVHP
jgi:hypothetical protein